MRGIRKNGQPYRVLIVDDSMFVIKQLRQILISEGFKVMGVAENGFEAVELYQERFEEIDLVTMDITMPKMDGISALERIMAINKDAVVIMISALGREDLIKRSIILGAKSFIVKPLDRHKVLDRLEAILQHFL